MPRQSESRLPKYRSHSSGHARVVIEGETHYLGKHGSRESRQEYDRIVGDWLANGRTLPLDPAQPITVTMLCNAYLKYAKQYYVKNGKITDEVASIKVAIKFLRKNYSRTLVEDFGPLALKSIQQQMIANSPSLLSKLV